MLFHATNEPGRAEGGVPTTAAVVYPTLGTLLMTGAAASMTCRTPDRPFASWASLLAYAAALVAVAAAVHGLAVWGVCRVYRRELEAPVRLLLVGTWICAALLPAAVLLAKEGSAWAAGVLPVVALAAVLFMRRGAPGAGREANSPAPAGIATGLFGLREPPPLTRTLLPAVLVAVGVEAGVAMLLSWQWALAGLLFGLCLAAVVWRVPLRVRASRETEVPARWRVPRDSGVAMLMTVMALLPSLSGSGTARVVARLLGSREMSVLSRAKPPQIHTAGGAAGGALSGVILTLPPKPKQRMVPPPPTGAMQVSGGKARPMVLPFDGAYWYFRSPDTRPRAGAKTVRGDPTKVEIQSTDSAALQMEAHQRLDPPLRTDCCSEMRVTVRNGDRRPGAIGIELVLEGASGKGMWRQSLGTRVIASSVGTRRAGEEVLRFPMPAGGPAREFREITVAMRGSRERARVGAQVAVEQFELVGR